MTTGYGMLLEIMLFSNYHTKVCAVVMRRVWWCFPLMQTTIGSSLV